MRHIRRGGRRSGQASRPRPVGSGTFDRSADAEAIGLHEAEIQRRQSCGFNPVDRRNWRGGSSDRVGQLRSGLSRKFQHSATLHCDGRITRGGLWGGQAVAPTPMARLRISAGRPGHRRAVRQALRTATGQCRAEERACCRTCRNGPFACRKARAIPAEGASKRQQPSPRPHLGCAGRCAVSNRGTPATVVAQASRDSLEGAPYPPGRDPTPTAAGSGNRRYGNPSAVGGPARGRSRSLGLAPSCTEPTRPQQSCVLGNFDVASRGSDRGFPGVEGNRGQSRQPATITRRVQMAD